MPKAKRPTADDISRRMVAAVERKRLESEARKQKAVIDEIDGRVLGYLKATEKTTSKFGEFRATLETVPGRVAWKDAAMEVWPHDRELPTGPDKDKLTFGPA